MLNARDAAERGADIRTAHPRGRRAGGRGIWQVTVEDTASGARRRSRPARWSTPAGPGSSACPASGAGVKPRAKVRLVQGCHIVVRKLFDHDRAYMFQNRDGRIVFAIPYEDDFTLIGTTDRDFDGDPAAVEASPEEIDYLCDAASATISPDRSSRRTWCGAYSGVRPLYDDGASEAKAATRDYVLGTRHRPAARRCCRSIGGKITTYRRLAEEALERLAPYLPQRQARRRRLDRKSPLPGGDLDVSAIAALTAELLRHYPFLTAAMRAASRMPTAPAPPRCWATRNPSPISANRSAPR